MINHSEILSTIQMRENENLDVRTITMGISLLDCIDTDIKKSCDKIIKKITTYAKNLVKTGEDIEAEFGIPIVKTCLELFGADIEVKSSTKEEHPDRESGTQIDINFNILNSAVDLLEN